MQDSVMQIAKDERGWHINDPLIDFAKGVMALATVCDNFNGNICSVRQSIILYKQCSERGNGPNTPCVDKEIPEDTRTVTH